MSTHEILNWFDGAGTGMAQAVMDYRKHGDMISLSELNRAMCTMYALLDELMIRHENSV